MHIANRFVDVTNSQNFLTSHQSFEKYGLEGNEQLDVNVFFESICFKGTLEDNLYAIYPYFIITLYSKYSFRIKI